jgi:hypothetical protein
MRTSIAAWDGSIHDATSAVSKNRVAVRIGEPIKTTPLPD